MFANDTKFFSLLGLAATLVMAPAIAQNTSSAISGRVTGADGQAISGAKVEATHKESGSTSTVITDDQGRYVLRGLRVAVPYTVSVSKGGNTEKLDDVYLQLAQTSTIDLRLATAQASLATVTVTGTAASALDSMAMGAGTRLSRQELDAYGSIKRSLQDYARLDPRLVQTDKERGEISAVGQNARYNSITVDSVKINDTFGLESNGLPTIKQPISIDAIQAVQVNISNYDVTQKDYTGVNINAVTKSGSNELKGSAYFVYRDQSLVGDRFSTLNGGTYTKYPSFMEDTKGFTLGGPLIEDTLFFFTNYEEFTSTRLQPEFGPLGGTLAPVMISQSAIDQISQVAKTKYGMDIGKPGSSAPVSVKDVLVKLDWNINAQHRANLRVASTQQSETNTGSINATTLTLDSAWWKQKKQIDTVVGQWFADWTPTFSTEVKASTRNYDSNPENNSNTPSVGFTFTGALPSGAPPGSLTSTRSLNTGTDFSRQFNSLSQKTEDLYLGANWTIDDHEVKFGGDYSATKTFNAFFQGVNGSYSFGCNNSSAAYTYTFGSIVCSTATSDQVTAAILENFSKGRPSSYSVQVAAPGTTLVDNAANFRTINTGLFLQDTWTVNEALTITAGARVDTTGMPDKPRANAAAGASMVAGAVTSNALSGVGTVVRNSGGFGMDNTVTLDGQTLFQPRVGFNYALDSAAKEKSQLRGGFGLFQGAAPAVWLANPYSNTGIATRTFGCGGSFSSCNPAGGLFTADPAAQSTSFSNATPAAGVDFLDPSLSQPSIWKMNLAYESALPFGGLVAGAEVVVTKTKSAVYYKQLNLGAPTAKGTDGRDLFYTPKAYDPTCWSNQATTATLNSTACPSSDQGARAKALSNPAFANVTQATQTSLGGGNALTLALSKPAKDGFGWQAAYTRETATDVSPLTSSVANSNFNSRATFNPNDEVEANSAYLIKERFTGAINWSKAILGNRKTTVGLFYEGRVGKPYSWVYKNDMNGDGVGGNDLLYIPKAPGSGDVIFHGATPAAKLAAEDSFWAVVNSNKALSDAKGGVVSRNSSFSDMVHTFDLRLTQELDAFRPKHKSTFVLDIFNVGNLINKEWGRTNEALFQSGGGNRRSFVNYAGIDSATGKYIYAMGTPEDMAIRQNALESQWAVQATWKYEF